MGELIPLKEAQERAGISKNTLKKIIAMHGITVYSNPRDARQKLVDYADVEAALRPRPLRPHQDTKIAA